jgi:hypothetical protein
MKAGFAPFCPHLTCYMGGDTPEVLPCGTTHDNWYDIDLPWVEVSQAVLRLPGESIGADKETVLATSLGIPVYNTLQSLIEDKLILESGVGHKGFLKTLEEMKKLHIKKSADYGSDKDPLDNINSAAGLGIEPWRAALIRWQDKVNRIKNYCKKGALKNETVEDSLLDCAAYALIALALRRESIQ